MTEQAVPTSIGPGNSQVAAMILTQAAPPRTDAAVSAASPPAEITVVPPPASGEQVVVDVDPGERIVLRDPAFNPSQARYVVSGDDLLVQLKNGATVVLDDFFLKAGAPATLTVTGGPILMADVLLQNAVVVADVTEVKPGAGPIAGPVSPGNASFSPYTPGDIGPGLDPLGPLGPTALGFRTPEELPREPVTLAEAGDGGEPPPPPPESFAPELATTGTITGTLFETPRGFNPPGTPTLPIRGEGIPIPDSEVNGLPDPFVTVDRGEREVSIIFQDEVALFKNSLGYYTVGADGTIQNPRMVFPNVNDFDTTPRFQDGRGPLATGDTVSLGTFPEGTRIHFFAIQNGANLNDEELLSTGRLEFRNPNTGEPTNIHDLDNMVRLGDTPVLVHIAADGTETVLDGLVFFSADASQQTPNHNRLNPDLKGHYVHGYDPETGDIVFGVEDKTSTDPRPSDRDFNDAIFRIHFGPGEGDRTVFLGENEGSLFADVTDQDSTQLSAARVEITEGAQAGDALRVTGFVDGNRDGIDDATGIRVTQVSDTRVELSGNASIESYETLLNSIRFETTSDDPQAGTRTLQAQVFDVPDDPGEDINPSNVSTVTIDIRDDRILLTDGNDTFTGTDEQEAIGGLDGNDTLAGLGDDDILDGGEGNDTLSGGDGADFIVGSSGRDDITGGAGGDRFVITGLSDGRDVIRDFDVLQGDRLDLSRLFEGTSFDPDAPEADDFLRFRLANLDGGGTLNDVAVEVDLDGGGSAYTFQPVAHLFNPTNAADLDIQNATTFGSNGATS